MAFIQLAASSPSENTPSAVLASATTEARVGNSLARLVAASMGDRVNLDHLKYMILNLEN